MEIITWINNNILWGTPMLFAFMGSGIFFTIKIRGRQFNIFRLLKETIFSKNKGKALNNLSPFQTLTSTLAVTLGTGNIVAIGTAIYFGGAGSIFWMIVSAFLGMATTYAENFFGMKHRRRNDDGTYFGGAFFYIERAMGEKWAKFFALCCLLTGFGMGNMTQMNAAANTLNNTFMIPNWLTGITVMLITAFMVFGGAKFFGEITEKVIPILSGVYILGCLIVICVNIRNLPEVFIRIISEAFDLRSFGGGLIGTAMVKSMGWGLRRGVFSNEAGLGSTVILNAMSESNDAENQGTWAMLTAFFDTVIMCTLTALVILLSGADKTGVAGEMLTLTAFRSVFGSAAEGFISICIAMFAIATVSGWSVFNDASVTYLLNGKFRKIFMFLFVIAVFIGAIMDIEIAWGLADLFNGLMAVPNLISVFILSTMKKLNHEI